MSGREDTLVVTLVDILEFTVEVGLEEGIDSVGKENLKGDEEKVFSCFCRGFWSTCGLNWKENGENSLGCCPKTEGFGVS